MKIVTYMLLLLATHEKVKRAIDMACPPSKLVLPEPQQSSLSAKKVQWHGQDCMLGL